MAVFFDLSDQKHFEMLHSSVRDSDDLQSVVDSVEWEVINAFSQRDMEGLGTYEAFFEYEFGRDPNDEIKVRLAGYDSANPGDSDSGLKEALSRTIAEIVNWKIRNYDNPDGVESIRQGDRSISYSGHSPSFDQFPTGWDRRLKNYDARISPYGI